MWTLKEIQEYAPRQYQPLLELYEKAGLKDALPDSRAEYLAERVLNLTMADHDFLLSTAAQKGRPAAMNLLEDLVIAHHKEKARKQAEQIVLPFND
jgi:hypothetical protein